MMINKRLISLVPESKRHIIKNVLFQWLSLLGNIAMILSVTWLLANIFSAPVPDPSYSAPMGTFYIGNFIIVGTIVILAIIIRFICIKLSARESFLASKSVKSRLRYMIYNKLLHIGNSYEENISSSEIVQVAVEGVDQLETYFGSYLPQFFYSMIAPFTLFGILSFINFPSAIVLLVCVPLIPVTIALVQTFAKKLLSKYWGQYTALGDTFLENLQGLTTLKIYQTDGLKHKKMNEESEQFRKITMKVLTMQLNSITIMDLIAYGGAALGIIMAALQFKAGNVSLGGGLAIILLAADFFIPMRMLGSYFHIAMNGMAASDKIFKLLDLPETQQESQQKTQQETQQESPTTTTSTTKSKDFAPGPIICQNISFSYNKEREILHNISLDFPSDSFTAIVGESGSGKSTLASLLVGRNKNFSGNITIGGINISEINEKSLLKNITYIGYDSHIFKGTVKDNLIIADETADKNKLWNVLDQVKLSDFLYSENGLETEILERGSNLSGGQRQRLALARGILHNSPIYIFDEATSNIDIESETDIMNQIKTLAETKTVIMITHRLANAVDADNIYVMENGYIFEKGTHKELLKKEGIYKKMWNTQSKLENFKSEKAERNNILNERNNITNGGNN